MAIPTTRFVREAYECRYDRYNYNGSYAINNDDMCYRDPSTGYLYPMANLTTANYSGLSTVAKLQRFAAKYYAGTAGAAKLATDLQDLNFPVCSAGVLDMVCASGSNFPLGQLVAVSPNTGNNGLLSDTVIAVNDPGLAIGEVVIEATSTQYPGGTALVRCLLRAPLDGFGTCGVRHGKLTETIPFGSVTGITGSGPYTGTYTFTEAIPAGAMVLGYRANIATAFAGTSVTAVTVEVGYTGHLSAFSADTSQSAFAAGNIASLATAAGPQVSSDTSPIVTFTITGGNTLSAGSLTLSVIYIAPEGP